jgi:hypothetical protein
MLKCLLCMMTVWKYASGDTEHVLTCLHFWLSLGKLAPRFCLQELLECVEECLPKENKADVKGIDIEVVEENDECVELCQWRYRTCFNLSPFLD